VVIGAPILTLANMALQVLAGILPANENQLNEA
jgi:hypothetical protein